MEIEIQLIDPDERPCGECIYIDCDKKSCKLLDDVEEDWEYFGV